MFNSNIEEYVQVSKGDAHVDCFKCSICKQPISGPVGFTDVKISKKTIVIKI